MFLILIEILPLYGVNFIALAVKFIIIYLILFGSLIINREVSSSILTVSSISFYLACKLNKFLTSNNNS